MRCLFFLVFLIPFAMVAMAKDKETAVTIYNNNLGLVRDVRDLEVPTGQAIVKFVDVAAQIDPTSVHFKSLTAPDKVAILEQNYQYDLVTVERLLEKYVDNQITITTKEAGLYQGLLLSARNGDAILQTTDGSIKVIKAATIYTVAFPRLPDGLITRPTLIWQLKNEVSGKQKIEVSYLTSGISWHAEYVAVVNATDTKTDLSGWVSIDNQSGATYEDAKLKLIAGDVHRAEPDRILPKSRVMVAEMVMAEPQFEQKAFFEYHMYTLQRPATVKDNEIKQISLFPAATVAIKKLFTYNGARNGKDVRVNIEFMNSANDGLGMPLPKGTIRVFKEDTDKSKEFIGEDAIDHTPKDEKIRIYLGNAFDIVGERNQTDRREISKRAREEDYSVKIRNHKQEAVLVTVIENFYGDWKITNSSHPSRKKDAQTAEFDLQIPKDGEVELTYTVLIKW